MIVLLLLVLLFSQNISSNDVFRISASGSSQVGESCSQHSDCVPGAACHHASCKCLASHVPLDRFCWKKIQPGEAGCSFDEQCDAVWPGTRCISSSCKCPGEMKLAKTREGSVCHMPGECPTNGRYSMLYNRNTETPAQCFFFDNDERPGRFMGCDDFPELFDCIDGLCCPTRALTCAQSLELGSPPPSGDRPLTRWFFDSDSQNCAQFQYAGVGGNANNFDSQAQCESVCAERCPRGQPQLSADGNVITCDTKRRVCGPGYQCLRSGITAICCPSTEMICSFLGGLTPTGAADSPHLAFHPGSNRAGQPTVTRWYWDSKSFRCRPFKYLGQGGNWNNFVSEESCQAYCDRAVCPLGQPLRELSGGILSCGTQAQCPTTHSCTEGYCCPTAASICNLPLTKGVSCSSPPSQKYWFDSSTGLCVSFKFLGCQGNSNAFSTMEQCQSACSSVEREPKCERGLALRISEGRFWSCGPNAEQGSCPQDHECTFDGNRFGCCPSRALICSSPVVEGTSCLPGSSLRWSFDQSTASCTSFTYLGCDGNPNNFVSQRDCQEYCMEAECPYGGAPLISSEGQKLSCSIDENCRSKDHFCWSSGIGNPVCCPTRKAVCSRPIDGGLNCTLELKRYYFDPETSTCRSFKFSGCGGNENNFPTKAACSRTCHSAACAPSEILYESSGGDAFDCSRSSCPKGYSCVPDAWEEDKRVCCSAPSFGVCPPGQRSLIGRDQQSPRRCSPGTIASCPKGFACLFNPQRNNFFCCGEEIPATCPSGSKSIRWSPSGDPRGCISDSSCEEADATCIRPSNYRSGVCCLHANGDCPPTFILDKEATDSGECSPFERESCGPLGISACLFSDRRNRFVCCRRPGKQIVSLQKCPIGSIEDEQRFFCSHDKPCPSSHFCVRRDADRVGLCCRHPSLGRVKSLIATSTPTPKYICPQGTSALMDARTSAPQMCTTSNSCPSPFTCIPSSSSQDVHLCCETKVIRPCSNGAESLSIDGRDFSCRMKSCPPGYSCENEICCPMEEFACSEPMYIGTFCENLNSSSFRFFFDRMSLACRSFDYRGCNPGANTWKDEKSCESACLPTGLKCPSPFSDPVDAPQFCEKSRPSCGPNEQCLTVPSGRTVCCIPKRIEISPTPSSLHSLMLNICGPGKLPVKARDGDPRRCSTRQPCAKGESCLFSSVLMMDICCIYAPIVHSYPIECEDCPKDSPQIVALFPGETGCSSTSDCRGQSVCVRGLCTCRRTQVQFHRMCQSKCPAHYRNVDGVCI